MSIAEKIKYSICKEDLYVYEKNKHGVQIERWTPYLKKVMFDILDHLESLPSEFKEDQMFVDGEFDSNQTDFERKSNHIEIGAKANTNVAGYILLFFMRMIIDDNPHLFEYCFESYADSHSEESAEPDEDWVSAYDDEKELNINQMVKVLKEYETDYTSVTPISEVAKQTLMHWDSKLDKCVETHISKKAEEIDLWDISRVRAELKKI